jgi:hypothetical protein
MENWHRGVHDFDFQILEMTQRGWVIDTSMFEATTPALYKGDLLYKIPEAGGFHYIVAEPHLTDEARLEALAPFNNQLEEVPVKKFFGLKKGTAVQLNPGKVQAYFVPEGKEDAIDQALAAQGLSVIDLEDRALFDVSAGDLRDKYSRLQKDYGIYNVPVGQRLAFMTATPEARDEMIGTMRAQAERLTGWLNHYGARFLPPDAANPSRPSEWASILQDSPINHAFVLATQLGQFKSGSIEAREGVLEYFQEIGQRLDGARIQLGDASADPKILELMNRSRGAEIG